MGRELGWGGGRVTDAVAGGDFLGGGSGDAYGNRRAVPGFPWFSLFKPTRCRVRTFAKMHLSSVFTLPCKPRFQNQGAWLLRLLGWACRAPDAMKKDVC